MSALPPSPPLREAWQPAPDGALRCLGGFLRVLDVQADSVAAAGVHGDAFGRLSQGSLQAIVLRGVYRAQTMARAVQRLARHDPPFVRTGFPAPFRAGFYGRNVNLSDPALSGYFAQAAEFNRQLDRLIEDEAPLLQRIGGLLSALDGGRPYRPAPGPAPDSCYMPMTLRHHAPGGFIPAHFDNEVRLRPSYRHLAGQVQAHVQSFVLTLDPGAAGGALTVYALCCEPDAARLLNDDHAPQRPDTARLAAVQFRLDPGDMVVLDSGRWLHELTPVQGARTRWTACGFMALARDGHARLGWG